MRTFKELLIEATFKDGDWLYQKTGSDGETFALVIGKDKGGGYKVVFYDGSTAGKAVVGSTKNWRSTPTIIDMKKVPPKIQDKIMAKAEKYL